MKFILALILALIVPCQAAALDYVVQSGEGAGAITPAGNDSANCTVAFPCATLVGAVKKLLTAIGGHANGGGHSITLRGGDYETGTGLVEQGQTLIPSGSSWSLPFTFRAYNASSPGSSCTPATLTFPGEHACETVRFIRAMGGSGGAGAPTLAQIQGVNGPGCVNGTKDCVGPPTKAECNAKFPSGGYSYPHDCWAGNTDPCCLYLIQDRSGRVVNEGVVEMYPITANPTTANRIKYVVFDGINVDARGVAVSALRSTQHFDHTLTAEHFKFRNGSFSYATNSCTAQPGIANGMDYGNWWASWLGTGTVNNPHGNQFIGVSFEYLAVLNPAGADGIEIVYTQAMYNANQNPILYRHVGQPNASPTHGGTVFRADYINGERPLNDWQLFNFAIHDCGVPYARLQRNGIDYGTISNGDGTNARESSDAAYLHGFYLHAGGITCDFCAMYRSAGFGFAPDGNENFLYRSFIFDNNYGVQMSAFNNTVANSVFVNNRYSDMQMLGVGDKNPISDTERTRILNNTFVAGSTTNPVESISVQAGQHGARIQNNIFSGPYQRGITVSACGILNPTPPDPVTKIDPNPNDSYCAYTERNTIRNNVFGLTVPGNEIVVLGTDNQGQFNNPSSNPSVHPACVPGVGVPRGTMSACNKYLASPAAIKFASTSRPNYPLASDSPAKDYGVNDNTPGMIITDDYLANQRNDGATDAGAFEYCVGGACILPPSTATVTVQSSGASSVLFSYTGTDCTGPGTGTSTFTFTCPLNTLVTVVAPPAADGNNFSTWNSACTSQDIALRRCNLTLTTNATLIGSFGGTHTLTITTVGPDNGIPISIVPNDINNRGGCTPSPAAPCIRIYQSDIDEVTITVPEYAPGAAVNFFGGFVNCPRPGSVPNFGVCKTGMGSDRAIAANYSGDGCHIHKDLTRPPWDNTNGLPITLCSNSIRIYASLSDNVEQGTQSSGATGVIVGQPVFWDNDSDYAFVNFDGAPPSGTAPNVTNPDGYLTTFDMITSTALNTAFTSTPTVPTISSSAAFQFTGSGGTAPRTFECKLDAEVFSACISPKTLLNLAFGSHTFSVRAVDATGAVDQTPVSFTWTRDEFVRPVATITDGPGAAAGATVNSRDAVFVYSTADCAACQIQCRIDSLPLQNCGATTQTFTALLAGTHTFYVKAISNSGQQSDEASYQWNIQILGGGTFTPGNCVENISGGNLNIMRIWNNSGSIFSQQQPNGAIGVIEEVTTVLSPQGNNGLRINWQYPKTINLAPKNQDIFSDLDPDGWSQQNSLNLKVLDQCPQANVPPGTPAGATIKINAAIMKLGGSTLK